MFDASHSPFFLVSPFGGEKAIAFEDQTFLQELSRRMTLLCLVLYFWICELWFCRLF
jgi:hypothetical protein